METPTTLGERIAAIMERRHLSQEQVHLKVSLLQRQAQLKARVTQGHLSMILRGERKNPSVFTIAALAQALDVSIDWLVGLPKRDPTELDPDEADLLALYRQIKSPELRRLALSGVRNALEAYQRSQHD
jgi:transcriptional regulator with XRE-family HTH domain